MTAVKKKAKSAIVKREPDDPPDEIENLAHRYLKRGLKR